MPRETRSDWKTSTMRAQRSVRHHPLRSSFLIRIDGIEEEDCSRKRSFPGGENAVLVLLSAIGAAEPTQMTLAV